MYSYEDRTRAVKLYIKLGKRAAVATQAGEQVLTRPALKFATLVRISASL